MRAGPPVKKNRFLREFTLARAEKWKEMVYKVGKREKSKNI
jgi:hypothetical protein